MPQTIDAAAKIRLGRGEVLIDLEPVPGSSAPRIVVKAVFDAPPEVLWKHIDNSSRYAEFMPRVKSAQELSRNGDDIRTKLTLDMPFPLKNLTAITRAKHIVEPGVSWRRQWVLEEGDYHVNEGSWTIVPFDEPIASPSAAVAGETARRSLAIYRVHVLPKIPIPKAIQSAVQEKAMPKLIEAIKARLKA